MRSRAHKIDKAAFPGIIDFIGQQKIAANMALSAFGTVECNANHMALAGDRAGDGVG